MLLFVLQRVQMMIVPSYWSYWLKINTISLICMNNSVREYFIINGSYQRDQNTIIWYHSSNYSQSGVFIKDVTRLALTQYYGNSCNNSKIINCFHNPCQSLCVNNNIESNTFRKRKYMYNRIFRPDQLSQWHNI